MAIYPAEGSKVARYRPLQQNPALYGEFAKLDGSEQSCLEFARRYGLLYANLIRPLDDLGNDPGVFETLRNWKGWIENIRETIRRCELSRSNPSEAFRQFARQDKQLFGVELYLSIKSPNSPATLDVRVGSLAWAMELQAIQSVLGGRQSHQCIECTGWFEIGAGARRSQSKFCSTRCKDIYHNRRKSQARRDQHA